MAIITIGVAFFCIHNNVATADRMENVTDPTVQPSGDLATRLGGTNTGIYYPLYSLSEFPQVLAAKKAFPSVPFMVNINPESGPGSGPSSDWSSAITQLKSAGAVVTGYVPTGYGTDQTISSVENMISSYNSFYPGLLDGIMFDEVSDSCSYYSFYQTVSNYARSLGYNYIRANPGSSICQTDVPLFNDIAIYESSGYPSESTLSSSTFYPQYAKDVLGFGATIHSTTTYDSTWLHMATKYLKWVYITDQTEPDPYAEYPAYFNSYLTDLSNLAGTVPLVTGELIPNWIKYYARGWSQGQVGDGDFTKGIQYLIEQGILHIPQSTTTIHSPQQIPHWIKKTAGWWVDGQVSDDEFVKCLQYLISAGIIKTT